MVGGWWEGTEWSKGRADKRLIMPGKEKEKVAGTATGSYSAGAVVSYMHFLGTRLRICKISSSSLAPQDIAVAILALLEHCTPGKLRTGLKIMLYFITIPSQ